MSFKRKFKREHLDKVEFHPMCCGEIMRIKILDDNYANACCLNCGKSKRIKRSKHKERD